MTQSLVAKFQRGSICEMQTTDEVQLRTNGYLTYSCRQMSSYKRCALLQVMISIWPIWTFGSIASLLGTTLFLKEILIQQCTLSLFLIFFGTNPGHHAVTSFTKPGPAILTWPISFAPCLLISIIKSTKWRFLSSLFINRSFHTFRSIQCEQFKEKLEWNSGLGLRWSSFCGTLSLISQLIYDDIAKMFHLTAGNG